MIPRQPSFKERHGILKILKRNSIVNDQISSDKSIYKLANKFRSKNNIFAGSLNTIKEVNSEGNLRSKAPVINNIGIDIMKYNYNINETSSDSIISEDYDVFEDDIFITNMNSKSQRVDEDLRKTVKKHVKNREMKFNKLSIGDDFAEAVAEQLKKDNNLQKIHLSNNRLSTRGAMAIFDKISDSCQFLDISFNPEIKRDAYKFLSRYVLKDYRK